MKILYLIGSLGGGGAEKVMSTLINSNKDKFDQKLITYSDSKVYDIDVDHEILGYSGSTNKVMILKNLIERYQRVKKDKKNFDACISFMETPNIMNVLTGRKTIISIRSLTTENIKSLKKYRHMVINGLLKYTYPRANKVVAVSNVVKEDLIKNYNVSPEKIHVVYNPINHELINRKKLERIDSSEENIFSKDVIIHCGRFTEAKGHWYLLKVFKKILEKHDCNLVLLGDGELREQIENLVTELNIEDKVFILGFKENPYKYLNKATLFLYTSLWEGFPNAILDAMACSLPVVSSDCISGSVEIIEPSLDNKEVVEVHHGKYGVITPRFERNMDFSSSIGEKEEMVASSVVNLLKNPEKMDHYKEMSELRNMDFSIEEITRQWEDIIRRV